MKRKLDVIAVNHKNPATGLPIRNAEHGNTVDVAGNPYGTDFNDNLWQETTHNDSVYGTVFDDFNIYDDSFSGF